MTSLIGTIRERLTQIRDGAVDDSCFESWTVAPLLITPWEFWTLLSLVQHRSRQQFVADTVQYRLSGDIGSLATAGSLGHPDIATRGIVPGMIEWEYDFHGRGCCLTHRPSSESIDVDFFDSTADWFDTSFYVHYLESLREPKFVEARVISLHPSFETVMLTRDRLLGRDLLEEQESGGGFRLTFRYQEISTLLGDLTAALPDPNIEKWIAAAASDWLWLEEMAQHQDERGVPFSGEQQREFAERAEATRHHELERLRAMFHSGEREAPALDALRDLESPNLDALLVAALEQPPSRTTSKALDIIETFDDKKWPKVIRCFMSRTSPNGELPSPHNWLMCAEILLNYGRYKSDIRKRILDINSHVLAEVAILALEHFPDACVELFRKALRSDIPCNRSTGAAALAIVDKPWSHRELKAILDESRDQDMTSECRSALMESTNANCHERVAMWETANPQEPETGPGITMSEMRLRGSDTWIRWEMASLHDRVFPLRAVEIP
jgi:hypothetical protein